MNPSGDACKSAAEQGIAAEEALTRSNPTLRDWRSQFTPEFVAGAEVYSQTCK